MVSIKHLLVFEVLILVLVIFTSCQKYSEDSVSSADGVSIHYHARGAGDPALVFVHGWSCDKTYWDAQVDSFAQNYRVATIDLGGHGKSGRDRKDWTIEAFGRDVQAVVEKLNLDPVILIGHSMGGPVIIEATRHIQQRVIGLIGVDTFQNFENEPTQEEINTFLAPMREDFRESTKNFIRNVLFAPDSDSTLVKKVTEDMASAPPEVGISALENAWTYDIRAALKDVQIPIRSINSDLYPVNIEVNKRHAHSFEVKFMSGVSHFLMLEDPEKFNKLLEETIADLMSQQTEE